MVKVLPTTFSLFESQNIINSSAEPLCISCSDENVFIACEGCILEVYNISTREQIAKIRTIWPAQEVVYNKHGDCIVTIEARSPESPAATSRVYFNWRGIGDFNRPHRVVLMGSTLSQHESVDAEIVELPVENCSCVSVCELTGVIAVGSEKTVRCFALILEAAVSLSTGGYKMVSVLNVRTDMKLRNVKICGNYIACISTHRIRVIKFLIIGSNNHPWSSFQFSDDHSHPESSSNNTGSQCEKDTNYFLWSPSHIWKAETRMTPKIDGSQSHVRTNINSNSSSPLVVELAGTKNKVLERSLGITTSPSNEEIINVSTINLPAITHAITEARRDGGKHELEVLGPVEYVWGQPLTIETQDELGANAKCRALTMLYRRFASTGYAYVHVSSNESGLPKTTSLSDSNKQRSASMGGRSSNVSGSLGSKHRGGIHSIQLVPTVTTTENGHKELIGMSCVLANRTKGFMYDIYEKSKQITSVSFMSRSQTLCFDGNYFHALSGDAVDSYTTRVLSSVLSRQKMVPAAIGKTNWITQPCPSSSMELTLISSNKFIGCFDLVASPTHNVVLCKLNDGSPPFQPSSTFLESLIVRRRKLTSKGSWNIYILEKKPVLGMFKQFAEFGASLEEMSPPVMQHHLSEAHLLLRSLVIEKEASQEVTDLLRDNCFSLAQSLCQYSVNNKATALTAAGYYLLSGRPIVDVLNHILSHHTENTSKTPFIFLVKYLHLVLFEPMNATQTDSLLPLADRILELITKYDCDRLPDFVLYSWFKGYSKEKAFELLKMLLPKVKTTPRDSKLSSDSINLALCCILCEMDRKTDALETLSLVSEDYLIPWTQKHPEFMLDVEQCELKPLGKVIMEKAEIVFMELVLSMLQNRTLEWNVLCRILKVNETKTLTENQMLKKLLETIINDNIINDPTIISSAAEILASLLIKRILLVSCTSNISCVQFGTRHSWLNKLPPFENSVIEKSDSVLYSNASQSCLRDLMELQSLLCSNHACRSLAVHIDSVFSEEQLSVGNVFMISIKLLTYPYIDKTTEATMLLLGQFPSVVVDYYKVSYASDLSKWKVLLEELLNRLDEGGTTEPADKNMVKTIYQDSLKYIATLTSPKELLALLPPNGNVLFFLPIIEHSCKLYLAGNISNNLHRIMANNDV